MSFFRFKFDLNFDGLINFLSFKNESNITFYYNDSFYFSITDQSKKTHKRKRITQNSLHFYIDWIIILNKRFKKKLG